MSVLYLTFDHKEFTWTERGYKNRGLILIEKRKATGF